MKNICIEGKYEKVELFINKHASPKVDLEECAGHPLSVLKYSCLKNMGSILAQQGDYDNSLAHYMQVCIEFTDNGVRKMSSV